MKSAPFIWFDRDMEEALRFYVSLFEDAHIDFLNDQPMPPGTPPEQRVRFGGFTLQGQQYLALQAQTDEALNHRFSIMVSCDTQPEIDRLWDALGEGGVFEQCGWVRDRWGLSWQIVPRRLFDLMNSDDLSVVARVGQAMLGMARLEIAKLEAAARD
ncbi:VOC family protein [Nitratireductor basaltis]|uniref:3-demethylubiquinone-9 3-methyltransferase n=1 Tax=Nitratireductor basaltis TaxID=472175 RepID=A0A084U976_9HYPH|nr:VOC family protein [Nitratireductor basaltis]KFB09512.1 3-demethylubiquinone-9 3-methyltransferase [Nitratireductor basaltis]